MKRRNKQNPLLVVHCQPVYICFVFLADRERLAGGDGGHRPRQRGPAEICRGAVSHPVLVHARTGQYPSGSVT